MTSVLEKTFARIRAGEDQRAAEQQDEYRALVRQCARGEEVDPDSILVKLAEWGCTGAAFQVDVVTLAHRIEMKTEVDQLPERRRRLAAVLSQSAAARREYEIAVSKAEAKLVELLTPLGVTEQEIVASISRGEDAAFKLVDGCSYPDVLAKRDAARDHFHAVQKRLNFAVEKVQIEQTQTVHEAEEELAWCRGAHAEVGTHDSDFNKLERSQKLNRAVARLADVRATIAEDQTKVIPALEHELAAAKAAFDEAQAALLAP